MDKPTTNIMSSVRAIGSPTVEGQANTSAVVSVCSAVDGWGHGFLTGGFGCGVRLLSGRWVHGWMDGWMNARRERWGGRWMDAWMHGWTGGWMQGGRDGQVGGCMHVWMENWRGRGMGDNIINV